MSGSQEAQIKSTNKEQPTSGSHSASQQSSNIDDDVQRDSIFSQESSKSHQSQQEILHASTNDDIFGGLMQQKDEINEDEPGECKEDKEETETEEIDEEPKQTFLSVWQEQHREELAEKAKEEREAQEKEIERGRAVLEQFNEQRQRRIDQQRKAQRARESNLKHAHDAVFEHGSIWQQVEQMVDLKADNKKTQRMKDFLIILKSQEEEKSDNMENVKAIALSFNVNGSKQTVNGVVDRLMKIDGFESKMYEKDVTKTKVTFAMHDEGNENAMDDPVINQAFGLLKSDKRVSKLKLKEIPYFVQR